MSVLDLEQLRTVTLGDEGLMHELLDSLIADTGNQLHELERALLVSDARAAARLAHYSKGACASIGAESTARLMAQIEREAKAGDWHACGASLRSLQDEFEKLRGEAARLP
jgi:HPt (histidine-containing phosphotransfer) domain-containing protein